MSLTYAVLGLHMDQHLVIAVLLAAFLSVAFFAFLRTVGLGTTLALAAAALLLVFPSPTRPGSGPLAARSISSLGSTSSRW